MKEQLQRRLDRLGVGRIDALAVLGSGMGDAFAADELHLLHEGSGGVVGHAGVLALLAHGNLRVLAALGRRHLYEGYDYGEVVATVRAAAALGARAALLTNAAGGLNPAYRAGDLMLINDTLGSMLGPRAHGGSERIEAVDHHARPSSHFAIERYEAVERAALARGVALHRGTYAAVLGPSYETRAEIRMLRRMGADAVGMSTALEAAEARRLGMDVVGLSLITNTLTDTDRASLDHVDVVRQGELSRGRVRAALDAVLATLISDTGPSDG